MLRQLGLLEGTLLQAEEAELREDDGGTSQGSKNGSPASQQPMCSSAKHSVLHAKQGPGCSRPKLRLPIQDASSRLLKQYSRRFLHACLLKNQKRQARKHTLEQDTDEAFNEALQTYLEQIKKTFNQRRSTQAFGTF